MPSYAVGPPRGYAENRSWFVEQREAALRVPCSFCGAKVSEPCRNGEHPLVRFPAHTPRVRAAAGQPAPTTGHKEDA